MKRSAVIWLIVVSVALVLGTRGASAAIPGVVLTPSPTLVGCIETNSCDFNVATFTDTNGGDTAASFTATIAWGDLTSTAGTIAGPTSSTFTISGTHTYAEDGLYTVLVTLTRTAGPTTASVSLTNNVEETLLTSIATPFTIPEGALFNGAVGIFTDPGSPDPASAFSATIDWGDGTTTVGTITGPGGGTYAVGGSHIYVDEGSFTAVATFSENSEPTFSITTNSVATVTEADVLAPAAALAPIAATEGGAAVTGAVARFSATGNSFAVASDFTATINWGDGSTTPGVVGLAGSVLTVSASPGGHVYAEEGSFSVTATVRDDAPGTATATSAPTTVNVADAPLTPAGKTVSFPLGSAFTAVIASFTDADPNGVAADYTATINWGDGSALSSGAITANGGGGFNVAGTHMYVCLLYTSDAADE